MTSIKPTTVPAKTLARTISSSQLTFRLSNIKGWDAANVSASDFGTILYATFRNSLGTLMEIMEIDASTIASTDITINKRGLAFSGSLTLETAALKKTWIKGDTIVEIGSHPPQLLSSYIDLYSEQTITGTKHVSTPTASTQIANKAYVDSVVAGSATTDKLTEAGTAGETIAAGNWIYFDAVTTNEWLLADADTVAKIDNVKLGIAQGAGTDGGAIAGGVLTFGLDTNQTGMTIGNLMYGSDTAGAISSSAGTIERVIGIARTTTDLYFDPNFYYILTADQQASLTGAQGVLDSTNVVISTDKVSDGGNDQTQTTQDGSTEVGEADATLKKNSLAQSFIPAFTKISGVKLDKQADTGVFTGTVSIALQADSSGDPSESDLATVTMSNTKWLTLDAGEFEALFSTEYASMVVGDLYWIVITTSTSDNSNHPNIGNNSAGGYSSGSVKYNNTTDGWTTLATVDLYFKTLQGVISQVIDTDSEGEIPSKFYSTSKLPLPAYQQSIPFQPTISAPQQSPYAFGASQDGSVWWILDDGVGNMLKRYARDSLTGQYFLTHEIDPTLAIANADIGGIAQIGIYIYIAVNDNTNFIVSRFLAADLTGEQAMTVPTVAETSDVLVWSEGEFLYIYGDSNNTTLRKWSVSGTIFTAESTSTCIDLFSISGINSAMMFDGTTLYNVQHTTGVSMTWTINKLADILASASSSTTTKLINSISDTDNDNGHSYMINIDSDRMYIGYAANRADQTAEDGTELRLIPITKP